MDRPRHSPESSSHPHHPALFASLHRRPRAAAENNAPAEASKEARENASREARRYLLKIVRNDWSYEPTSSAASSSGSSETETPASIPKGRDILEWRQREEDSSNSDQDAGPKEYNDPGDPYRFESPDAVHDAMLEKKRKRRKIVEDEMEWNLGLRLWMQRRDAWTGAQVPKKSSMSSARPPRTSSDESARGSSLENDEPEIPEPVSPSSAHSGPSGAIGVGSACQIPIPEASPGDNTVRRNPVVALQTAPTAMTEEPLVPIVSPILPSSNPFRAYTNPANYPAIYSKLVIESNTPAVPINLLHMTRALVQGWRREGQWPPKPTITRDLPIVKKKRPQIEPATKPKPTTTPEEPTNRRRSLSSNVTGAVKKVLGFASIHPGHRFHARGSSQNNASLPHGEAIAETGKPSENQQEP